MIKDALALLGLEATDRITGVTGTVTTVCFDLYGCVQGALTGRQGKDGKRPDPEWFDVKRLETKNKRVMPAPQFGQLTFGQERGAAEKPRPPG